MFLSATRFYVGDRCRREVNANCDEIAMQAATRHGVDGIVSECGGSCMCVTCHGYVVQDAAGRPPPREESESDTLEIVPAMFGQTAAWPA